MTTAQLVIAAFAALIGGLMLPLSYGARMAVFMALIALAVLTLIGGGMQYMMSLFD